MVRVVILRLFSRMNVIRLSDPCVVVRVLCSACKDGFYLLLSSFFPS